MEKKDKPKRKLFPEIVPEEKYVYAVCFRKGGYFDTNNPKGLQMPEYTVVRLTEQQWVSAKGIQGVKKVTIGDNVRI